MFSLLHGSFLKSWKLSPHVSKPNLRFGAGGGDNGIISLVLLHSLDTFCSLSCTPFLSHKVNGDKT